MMKRAWLRNMSLVIVLAASCLFAFSAMMKLQDPGEFTRIVRSHDVLPLAFTSATAVAVIVAEIGVSVLGLWALSLRPAAVPIAGFLMSMLFAAFSVYAVLAQDIPPVQPSGCGCGFRFSEDQAANWAWLGVMDGALSVVLALAALSCRFKFDARYSSDRPEIASEVASP